MKQSYLFLFALIAINPSCSSYDPITESNNSLVGKISQALNSNRSTNAEIQESETGEYVDYSRNNPLLRHEEEFDKKQSYQGDDPFFEEDKINQVRKVHQVSEPEDSTQESVSASEFKSKDATKHTEPKSFWSNE